MKKSIYHIAEETAVIDAQRLGYYQVASLQTEGFIHCSIEEEVLRTANKHFKGKKNLLLLRLDESAIAAKVIHENTSGGEVLYPHIYGKLNLNAIQSAFTFKEVQGQGFVFPEQKDAYPLFLLESHFLATSIKVFQDQKQLCDKSMQQLKDADFFIRESVELNSIAILIQHLSGNMVSRWTDFLTTDGEKPYRERDAEFEPTIDAVPQLMEIWEQGWKVLFDTLKNLKPSDLLSLIYIRGEALSVSQAILRQIAHYAQHTGQIILMAKRIKGDEFKTLSIAKGMSRSYKP